VWTGYVDRWLFQPGAEVAAGQVLYVLDLRPFEASVEQARGNLQQSEADLDFARKQVSLLQAQANLASAEANLVKAQQDDERLKPLVAADAASQQDLDAAVAALRAAEETVKANKANVEQTALTTRTQIASTEGKVESNKGALKNRRAESRIRHHSRAHRRPHRRFAGSGGRPGDAHGGATAHHHRSARSHLGPLPGDRIGIPRLGQARAENRQPGN
jgi:hypothetical protein